MEEYIGACLIIKTNTATHIGRLQQIEPENNKMIVEVSGMLKTIELTEIDEVELLAEEDSQILQRPNTPQKTKQKDDDKRSKPLSYLSEDVYMKMVDLSDTVYGPSRSEIIYSGARGVLHLFVNIFRLMDKKFIVYTGSGVFSEIGIVLARLCMLYGTDVSLVPLAKTQRIAKELFYYEANNGKITNKRTGQPIVIIADTDVKEEMVTGAERVIFLGDYKNIPTPNKEVIFFGVPVREPLDFSGNAILCDVGLSPKIFAKFNIKKYAPKLLQKIAKP
ncbi:hypothetical protein NEMIN01_1912 [Nematocida minor]|uniref:uncharacterized protein n=1 Tax=Nematocida minor TaxID=1912983 RepID=UPI002220ED8E|nr:uncharacterized protein NEMIN01_1912 [Nematocida minor]KAI5192260.1 hypothetical protein NEMIN01_1912 [Nematocida minor]